ncbi:MAG: dTMP kinase [Candidatus Methanomethylicota archaeon]|nr:MAG: dTMP kinase [Candidatus Verstraetearchaeota archaeon]
MYWISYFSTFLPHFQPNKIFINYYIFHSKRFEGKKGCLMSLVALEGIDKSGKATQAKMLKEWLSTNGFPVEIIAFPDYSTPIGREIKAFLTEKISFNVEVRQLLYAANRWENKEKIEGMLKEGKIVIADRYIPSGLAYGYANGLPLDWMLCLERGLPEPDIVIVIDISPQTSIKRLSCGKDRYEKDVTFLSKVRSSYLYLAKKFNWFIVEGERSALEIFEDIKNILFTNLKLLTD